MLQSELELHYLAQTDWRGDGGVENDVALEAPAASGGARAAQARAAQGLPSHTLLDCVRGGALVRAQGLYGGALVGCGGCGACLEVRWRGFRVSLGTRLMGR